MVLLEYKGKKPVLSERCYVSPNATLIGNIKVNDNAIIWPGCIIRAENSQINIGEYSTIFDGVILFTKSNKNSINIGRYCIIESGVAIFGCFMEDYVQVLQGSIIYEDTSIGEGSIILNNSLVPPGLIIPARSVLKGSPVEPVREQSRNEVLKQKEKAENYSNLFIKIISHLPNAQSYLLTLPDFIKLLLKKEEI
ncbi:MAG: gamma carbonic anhydrase family protein [Promethearchaeota archaeon]